ncbi:MAG: hypothetical protein V7K89_15310 [Nostoc sp.]|uniref:hypothetical protein n=1 Tax=Nostoc sp. TaxID=1180 RepID=UPI002FFB6A55
MCGVGFGIYFAGSSVQKIQNGLSLVGVGIAISLGFAFAYFYQNHLLISQRETRDNGKKLSILGINFIWLRFPWLIAIILVIAQLTGALIHNCELIPKTKLVGVECDYIYTKLPTNNNPDPGRKPEVNGRIFKPGELAEVLMTLYST